MKRVAIITLNGYHNYGNRLQNYALQEILKSLDFDVETLIVKIENPEIETNKLSFINKISRIRNETINSIFSKINNKFWMLTHKKEIDISKSIRTEAFKEFTLNYIKEANYCISDKNIPKDLSDRYDYFIVGSDQVWNPAYNHGSSIYFLTFAEKHKRIAYSPSFGVSKIESQYLESYKKWLSEMHRISVREDDGANIIKDLIGRNVPVLVDPTLLLSKEKWLSIAKKASNRPSNKYLLTYFLGRTQANYLKQIKDIAKANNLEIVNLNKIQEKETYRTGPSEFIDYINSCTIFCTDSFHGTVFSILLGKPFIVYERIGNSLSMFSRIDTLLNKFNLKSRKAENIRTNEDIFNIDFTHVPYVLEAERAKALAYLKEALNIGDGRKL